MASIFPIQHNSATSMTMESVKQDEVTQFIKSNYDIQVEKWAEQVNYTKAPRVLELELDFLSM